MPSLKITLLDNRRQYERNKHFKYFTPMSSVNSKKVNSNTNNCENDLQTNKFSYMTYRGAIKCLFNNKSKMAELFQDWCLKTLFTHQFGSIEEKQELSSKLLGVHAKTVKEVFSTSATNVPCVYLFTLGTVRDLKKSMNVNEKYSDDMIICKYGMTDSLERRAYEHNKNYGSINNVNLCLKYYAYIDQQYISNAETDIREYFEAIGCIFNYENHKELVILEPNKLNKLVKQQYANLSNMYTGHIKDLIKKIENLENKLLLQEEKIKLQEEKIKLREEKMRSQEEKHKNELELQEEKHKSQIEKLKSQEEKYKKDLELQSEKHKNELQKYEIELLKKELELSKVKSKK